MERLRTLRELRGLSQRELARRCGLSAPQIYKYENGRSDPTSINLAAIADQLGVSVDFLLGRTDNPLGSFGDGSDINSEEKDIINIFRREGWPGVIRLGGERLSK